MFPRSSRIALARHTIVLSYQFYSTLKCHGVNLYLVDLQHISLSFGGTCSPVIFRHTKSKVKRSDRRMHVHQGNGTSRAEI